MANAMSGQNWHVLDYSPISLSRGHAGIGLVVMRQRTLFVWILALLTLGSSTKAIYVPADKDGLPVRALKQFGEPLTTRYRLACRRY